MKNLMKNFTIIDIPQRSDSWKEFRKGKIGASQVAAIMGLSPWTTKLQVWEEIAFGSNKPINEHMERGIKLEAEALSLANERFGTDFKPVVMQNTIHPDLIASLDGWDSGLILEIKCPTKFSGILPGYYVTQMQHQMFVSGSPECIYMEYVNGTAVYMRVKRDEEFILQMVLEELAFLSSIVNFKPPEPSDKDWVILDDPENLSRASRYKELSLLITELEEERKDIREHFVEWSEHARTKCGDLKIQKVVSRGRVDYEQILEDYEITDTNKYRKPPTETWRLYL